MKLKTYLLYIPSESLAPDIEMYVEAKNKEEALDRFYVLNPDLREFNDDYLLERITEIQY